ncbi:unnamed protein product [Aphanomyces euteiches]|uniref:PHTF1/2 N-terminal domain-containing protein n=1 Tax=Aphanomyces euteiches TaxID=100861 RepID=A0A6G0XPD8_9STRA|nr:hypothetical protein Ae201684_002688 [Aphanomyces euteiches]KAH9116684.1 hypothetical protein AeMF1_009411 [Aphanomyces euteiches]KAH9136043.1 hypothetical protein LEN26_006290 [Aphanomyces euteiches]KAH9157804.1 hypothetical protein AeRB84_000359 [Aphanomyces euteiches]KAH9197723.1 hypothetical protein AeNC1_000307 [Aphanomyces euteiches]
MNAGNTDLPRQDLPPLSPLKPHRSRRNDKKDSPTRNSFHNEKKSSKKHDLPPLLNQEFIDFDVIKGSAFFNTKPSKYNKELVRQGFGYAVLFPFCMNYWKTKNAWFYWSSSFIYIIHLVAIIVYLWSTEDDPEPFTLFEIWTPFILLILTACGYGRVSSIVLSAPPDGSISGSGYPNLNLHSPVSTPQPSSKSKRDVPDTNDPSLIESEGSSEESGGSDSEGGDSSSSEDEPAHALDENDDASFMPSGRQPSSARRFSESSFGDYFTHRRVTVCVWKLGVPQKESMSITELRNHILLKVKSQPPRHLYRRVACASGCVVALVPLMFRILLYFQDQKINIYDPYVLYETVPSLVMQTSRLPTSMVVQFVNNNLCLESLIACSCTAATYIMGSVIFSALADAEVTYHRRFLYAKCFTALTSSRRSRASHLPHFRLKNVVNIKAWLSLRGGRSWLKRQGRQRAADEIVSTSFLIVLLFLAVMGVQAVSETLPNSTSLLSTLLHTEVTVWCLLSSIFLLRFMMLGSNINRKYQNTSLLLTEQMNLYLKLLVTPHKKEKLLISNNVLKLASKLLKELNSPNKISGLTMNPLLYNITRVVVLSAFSSALSEVFGFKLKLWKMKV